MKRYKARDLMRQIAEATHQCGDPGMQFDTTINRWHTSKNTARINASNPCSEYMFLDDSACNLASLNLMKFVGPTAQFDVEAYRHAVDTVIMAQEIMVDNAAYPTEKIAKNSHDFRPLGLGYANLGALLMSMGIPYDSDHGRDWAAALTAIMCGQAYLTSARIAEGSTGPCEGYAVNEEPFLDVIRMHRDATSRIDSHRVPAGPLRKRAQVLGRSLRAGQRRRLPQRADHGARAHRHHRLHDGLRHHRHRARSGAGEVQEAGRRRRDQDRQQHGARGADQAGLQHRRRSTPSSITSIPPAPSKALRMLKPEHLPVFDCSFRPQNGMRSIHYMGHVRMMAAVQPFISGAISKTINMPEECTVEDIMDAYTESWKLGLKAVAIYRDNSKRVQPLSSGTSKGAKAANGPAQRRKRRSIEKIVYRPVRRKLPDERARDHAQVLDRRPRRLPHGRPV